MPVSYSLVADVWVHRGQGGWHFVTVPPGPASEMKELLGGAGGWGSLPVVATVGETAWRTSIFPYKGSYVLPLKAAVRKAEGIAAGQPLAFRLTVG